MPAVWGGILIPEDVKSALKEVEKGLKLPLTTEWDQAKKYQKGTMVDATHFGPFPAPAGFASVNNGIYLGCFYGVS